MAHHPFDDPSAEELTDTEKAQLPTLPFEQALGNLMDEYSIPHLLAIYRQGTKQRRVAMAAPDSSKDVAYVQHLLQIASDAIDRYVRSPLTFIPEKER